jgi:hypothetical protein
MVNAILEVTLFRNISLFNRLLRVFRLSICMSTVAVSICPQKHCKITLRLQQFTLIGHIIMNSS